MIVNQTKLESSNRLIFRKSNNKWLTERHNSFLSKFTNWSWIILIISSILQSIIFPQIENIVAIACVVCSWLIVTTFFLCSEVLKRYPLSTFLILGFVLTQYYFPLFFTLVEGKPLIFNLDFPIQVFVHSVLAIIVITIAHLIYQFFQPSKGRSILANLGLFKTPKDFQLWIMGLLGLGAMFYIYFYSPSIGREVSGAGDKFIQGLIPFTYAPFFIPAGRLYGRNSSSLKKIVPILIVFAVLLLVVSLGRNSRGAFMFGFTSIGFSFFLGMLLGYFKPRLFTLKNILIVSTLFWLITGPLADIGTAMVIVRKYRVNTDRSELIEMTLEAYEDKEAIEAYREQSNDQDKAWDETYLDNIFLARFSNIKFNDASLEQANKIGENDPLMYQFSLDRLWAGLPGPLLSLIGINVDKDAVLSGSFGDFLFRRAGAGYEVIGGYRTGHFAGTGITAFGWWYLAILGLLIIPVFFLVDQLVSFRMIPNVKNVKRYHLQFSLCGLLALTSIFQFLPTESVIDIAIYLMRDWIQLVALYSIIFNITLLVDKIVFRSYR